MSHIVLVQGSSGIGGAERQGLLLAKGLVKNGSHRVTMVGFDTEGPLSEAVRAAGLSWINLSLKRPKDRLGYLIAMARFIATVRSLSPDAIIAYTAWPNIITGLAWRFTGARCGIWSQRDAGLELYGARVERLALSLSSLAISNSEHGAVFLTERYGLARERIRIIRNGVNICNDVSRSPHFRLDMGLAERVPLVCMAANLHCHKDHATLLRAWRIVLDEWPTDRALPVLLFAGRLDRMTTELKALAFDLKLERQTRLLGYVECIQDLFREVDLCVFSSHCEGLPNGVLEGMAAGLPVVGTDIPGIREAVGRCGLEYLAPPGDYARLAFQIRHMLLDKSLCQQLGAQMKERVATEFGVEQMVVKTLRCIEDGMN